MLRATLLLVSMLTLSACGGVRDDLAATPDPIGNFFLGHAIAVAVDPQIGPFSREATDEEWTDAVKAAVKGRFGRYDGDAYYHIAVAVQGYVLAQPGVPVLYQPKSVLIFTVTFYEDATQKKLNEEPIQLTVFEPCCSIPFLGSGLSKTREEQLEGLAFNAARAIERTMRENGTWFGGVAEVLPEDATILTGEQTLEVVSGAAVEN